jgi:hypothetical protein
MHHFHAHPGLFLIGVALLVFAALLSMAREEGR